MPEWAEVTLPKRVAGDLPETPGRRLHFQSDGESGQNWVHPWPYTGTIHCEVYEAKADMYMDAHWKHLTLFSSWVCACQRATCWSQFLHHERHSDWTRVLGLGSKSLHSTGFFQAINNAFVKYMHCKLYLKAMKCWTTKSQTSEKKMCSLNQFNNPPSVLFSR